jgi:hypothetical protein
VAQHHHVHVGLVQAVARRQEPRIVQSRRPFRSPRVPSAALARKSIGADPGRARPPNDTYSARLAYSSECVEGVFSEVRLEGFLGSSGAGSW